MLKKILILFTFSLLFSSCDGRFDELSSTTKPEPTRSQDDSHTTAERPKEILLLIGRGGSSYGHIISINKEGYIQYAVGSYLMKADESGDMTETFNSDLIKYDERYTKEQKQLSAENIAKLAELISDEEKLRFIEEDLVEDDYEYRLYLDKKFVAFGLESKMSDFPETLRSLIDLIRGEIKIHELPGMA